MLAVVFSLTVIVNAGLAQCMMGDKAPRAAYPGYVLVLVGAGVFAAAVAAPACQFTSEELVAVLRQTSSVTLSSATHAMLAQVKGASNSVRVELHGRQFQ